MGSSEKQSVSCEKRKLISKEQGGEMGGGEDVVEDGVECLNCLE